MRSDDWMIFVFAPCILIVLSSLFVQLMHTNDYKIVKQLKSFKIIIVTPTCFGLHKPSSGSSQPVRSTDLVQRCTSVYNLSDLGGSGTVRS